MNNNKNARCSFRRHSALSSGITAIYPLCYHHLTDKTVTSLFFQFFFLSEFALILITIERASVDVRAGMEIYTDWTQRISQTRRLHTLHASYGLFVRCCCFPFIHLATSIGLSLVILNEVRKKKMCIYLMCICVVMNNRRRIESLGGKWNEDEANCIQSNITYACYH